MFLPGWAAIIITFWWCSKNISLNLMVARLSCNGLQQLTVMKHLDIKNHRTIKYSVLQPSSMQLSVLQPSGYHASLPTCFSDIYIQHSEKMSFVVQWTLCTSFSTRNHPKKVANSRWPTLMILAFFQQTHTMCQGSLTNFKCSNFPRIENAN